jgi:hypothetical protein
MVWPLLLAGTNSACCAKRMADWSSSLWPLLCTSSTASLRPCRLIRILSLTCPVWLRSIDLLGYLGLPVEWSLASCSGSLAGAAGIAAATLVDCGPSAFFASVISGLRNAVAWVIAGMGLNVAWVTGSDFDLGSDTGSVDGTDLSLGSGSDSGFDSDLDAGITVAKSVDCGPPAFFPSVIPGSLNAAAWDIAIVGLNIGLLVGLGFDLDSATGSVAGANLSLGAGFDCSSGLGLGSDAGGNSDLGLGFVIGLALVSGVNLAVTFSLSVTGLRLGTT